MLLVFKVKHGFAPTYLSDLLQPMIHSRSLKDLLNANACWLVLIYDTLIITYVAKRISKYVSYIL